ncbi:MAG: LysR family transcriptional regulator [Rubrivivax sp.]|jgi:LysR family transcriptional regulator for bpeEF and oprC|nr:LysR family transcriptional regulator [Rubrivivax sp.]
MDRFDAMRAFVQVVDSGSFTRAADALRLHKASISHQVQQLEARLGVRLLTRTTRALACTAEGLAYYEKASAILQQVDEAETSLRKGGRAPAGRLRVDVAVALGRLVLVPEIRSFLDRYPRIMLELGCTDRTVDLVKEGVDCALRGGELPDSTLVSRCVGEVPFVLCAAPRYIEAQGLPTTPDELASHWRVGYLQNNGAGVRELRVEAGGATLDVAMKTRLVTSDSGAILAAGLDGLGLIQVAEFVARHHLASGALVRVLPGWSSPSMPIHFVTPTARQRTARVQAFMDWAQDVLARRLGMEPRRAPAA